MKAKHWRVYWPGDFYYFDQYVDEPMNAREIRAHLRGSRNLKRLPVGVHVEIATPLPKYRPLHPYQAAE